MEELPFNHLLRLPPGALQDIRKIHDLDRPGRVDEAVDILQNWVRKQEHFVKKDFSREYLEKTLISCKGSVEKAKKQIDHLCTMRKLLPKFFKITNLKMELGNYLDMASIVLLPKVTEDYYRVLMIKIKDKPITAESIMAFFRYNVILSEYVKANDYFHGLIIIDDFREMNLADAMTKLNLMELQEFFTILIEGYGTRVKSIYVLTESKVVDLLIRTVKQFVSEKIGNRMHVKNSVEDLYQCVPKEILPVDYGGDEKPLDKLFNEWVDELSSDKHMEYMKMINKACTDETKRQTQKFNEEYMGMPGSFRTLSLD